MPDFKYQGTNRSGSSVSGVMTAGSKAELQNLLKRQQITPTKMSEKGKEFNLPTFGGGVNAASSWRSLWPFPRKRFRSPAATCAGPITQYPRWRMSSARIAAS